MIYAGQKKVGKDIDKAHIHRYKAPKHEVGTFIDKDLAEHYIMLLTDDNKPFRINCPWCGYFETLNSIEIEEDKSDRKISFR